MEYVKAVVPKVSVMLDRVCVVLFHGYVIRLPLLSVQLGVVNPPDGAPQVGVQLTRGGRITLPSRIVATTDVSWAPLAETFKTMPEPSPVKPDSVSVLIGQLPLGAGTLEVLRPTLTEWLLPCGS